MGCYNGKSRDSVWCARRLAAQLGTIVMGYLPGGKFEWSVLVGKHITQGP